MALALAPLLLAAPPAARAAPSARVTVTQRGDFLLIGNVLGQECERSVPAPVVGTVGSCGSTFDDSGVDIFWRADSPAAGQAEAQTAFTAADARSTAVLQIPAGAEVTHAYLYWSAALLNAGSATDTTATLDRPGTFTQNLTALTSYRNGRFYQSVTDVTELVQAYGPGAYRVSGVDALTPTNIDDDNLYAAWWMVLFYSLDSAPVRQLALFEGLDVVDTGVTQDATLSGFVVPTGPFDATLAVVSFEGDDSINGDQFLFNNTPLDDGSGDSNNFFNASRSFLGNPVSNAGDLPQLTGEPGSNIGADFDVIDVTGQLTAGQSSVPIQASSVGGDRYLLGGFVTSVSTIAPDYTGSTKDATDVDGGIVLAGDTIEYTIVATNRGNDSSIETVITDPLPPEVTYVPGSLEIVSGPNAGAKTDAAGDDQAEYSAGTRTITARIGVGANATTGGTVGVGESVTLRFRVTINAGVTTEIVNQGFITARGLSGSGITTWPTDGEPLVPGIQQTVLNRDAVLIAQTASATTVAEGGATDTYSVALATVPSGAVTVTLTPSNSEVDIGAGAGVARDLTFSADAGALTPQVVTVTAVDDAVIEGNHSSLITHTSASTDTGYDGAGVRVTVDGLVRPTVPVGILDNDGDSISYAISANPASLTEGNSGAQSVTFTVARSGDITTLASTVDYSFTGSATTSIDYNNIGGTGGATGPSGTISFAANEGSKTITVDVLGDTGQEDAETISVVLSNPATTPPSAGSATIDTGTATVTIIDDDAGRTATITAGTNPAEPNTAGNFSVSLSSAAPSGGLTVRYAVSGTATAGSDYTALSGEVLVAEGATTADIPVNPIDDLAFDFGETVIATLSTSAGYSIGVPGSATLTIGENEQRTATIVAGDTPAEPSTNGSFIVSFNGPAPYAGMTLAYTVSGTATPGADYEALSGEIAVPSRATSVTIPVTVLDDFESDDGETIVVTLARRLGYAIGDPSSATLTIADEEPPQRTATIVAGDTPAEPGTNGSFVINLNVPGPYAPLTLRYTVGGTATPGVDYTALSGEVVLPSRATSVTIPVTILDDIESDAGETISVTLGRNLGYAIGNPSSATLTIADEEPPQRTATIVAGDTPAEPGTNGSFVVSFNIPAPYAGMTLAYTVGGTATAGADYEALSGEIAVPSRATSVTIPVAVLDDSAYDPNETIVVTLARRLGYAIGNPGSATLTIGENDARTATIVAGDTPAEPGTNGSFIVSFNGPAPYAGMTLAYTVGGTAATGADYEALSGEIAVPSRATSVTIPVAVLDDSAYDPNETIVVTLTRRPGYVIGDPSSATLTIGENDARTATIVAGDAPAEPGTAGSFIVNLNGPAPYAGMTLRYSVSGSAGNGLDYETLSGEIAVPSRATSVTIPVTVLDDSAYDPNETIVVTLARNLGYVIGTSNSATLTIGENDVRTATIVAGATPAEPGSAGSFIVSFNGPAPYAGMTLRYSVSGSAGNGLDYEALSGEIAVPSRATSVTIPIRPLDDGAVDPNETIIVTLGRSLGYAIGTPSSATLTIGDNDTAVVEQHAPMAPR